jgi:DNA-binding CsgD family transcriptional regulator
LEVKHKNQELANTAINLARKNEVLLEIKDDLTKVSDGMKSDDPDLSSLRRKILILNNKITENILEDNSLKKFEEHFDLVHNKFMENLTKKFPELTTNERKMCAFIKMDLSSKEIAPLLNISIRGVETLRYRLRKKIGLKQEEHLAMFLNRDFS